MIKSLRRHLKDAFLDCHLMVSNPEKWVDDFKSAGASQYTFHVEATGTPPPGPRQPTPRPVVALLLPSPPHRPRPWLGKAPSGKRALAVPPLPPRQTTLLA